jgi:WD40 repeat protein
MPDSEQEILRRLEQAVNRLPEILKDGLATVTGVAGNLGGVVDDLRSHIGQLHKAAEDLKEAVKTRPGPAPPPLPAVPPVLKGHWPRWAVTLVVLASIGLAMLVVLLVRTFVPPGASQWTPVHKFEQVAQVDSVALSSDGAVVAAAARGGIARWWTSAGLLLDQLSVGSGPSLALSPDARALAWASPGDHSVHYRMVAPAVWSEPLVVQGHTDSVRSLAFTPDGRVLASGADDLAILVWRLAEPDQVRRLEGHTNLVRAVALSPDASVLASGFSNGALWVWSVSAAAPRLQVHEHKSAVTCLAFSPKGFILASGSEDRTVRLWRIRDARVLQTLTGHDGSVRSLAFSPDGAYLASGSDDDTIRIWRVDDGRLARTLKQHQGAVTSLAFSADGARMISGSADTTVWLWRVR